LTVAWFSNFPLEWLPDAPDEVKALPRQHPASWQRVLFDQFADRADLKLHIIVLRKNFARELTFARRGVTFHLFPVSGGTRLPSLFWVDTRIIRRALERINPDVVHAWGTEQGAAMVANRLPYPNVVTIQGLISWYEKIVPLPVIVRLAGWIERASLPHAQTLTTEAKFTLSWLQKEYPKVRVEQIEHAPDPIFAKVCRQPQTRPIRMLFVGALDYRKGGDVLLLALDRLKSELAFELVVVGQLQPQIRQQIQGLGADLWTRVEFKQQLSPQQIAGELSRATLAVCASRADVSPNAVKEAVVAGVPVVATAVGGIPDYVVPGKNGLLCSAGDVAGLTEIIRKACTHPDFGIGRVDSATLTQMRSYLAPETMARRFLETYHSVLEASR
jgi:glycosyltransferase involved in cell wall biosynthesis